MYILFWSLLLSPVSKRFGWAESEFKSQVAMMASLGDNGFNSCSSDKGGEISRIVLIRCTTSLGAFAAGCGRGIVLSSKVILQPLAWSTFLTKCYSLQMIIWLSCNLHGGNTSRGGAPVPSGWRAVSCSGALNPLWHMDSGSFGLLLYGSRRWGMSGGCRWMRLRGGFPSHQVVTYAFGDKHCFRNYALQDCGLFIDVTASRPSSCGLHPHSFSC